MPIYHSDDHQDTSSVAVVIVEQHQHALEHVHDALRKQKKILTPWNMLHFDAHPDLACPSNVPAISCFLPRQVVGDLKEEKDAGDNERHNDEDTTSSNISAIGEEEIGDGKNLYELLDSTTSGIAVWILPLVLAGNLRTVEWVKPSFSSQFAAGDYSYCVGVDVGESSNTEIHHFMDLPPHAQVKVDLCHPYYLDDDSFVPSERLALKQKMNLCVRELPLPKSSEDVDATEIAVNTGTPWMLDICLDYFCCHNPYIQDIHDICPTAAPAFVTLMAATIFHSTTAIVEDDVERGMEYQRKLATFQDGLRRMFLDQHQASSEENRTMLSAKTLNDYFEDSQQGEVLLEHLVHAIGNNGKLLKAVLEAIPNGSMPHQSDSLSSSNSPDPQLAESLGMVKDAIQRRFVQNGSTLPFLITVARSSDDGFTPSDKVEYLQEQVLSMLNKIFCESDKTKTLQRNRLKIVRDYGEWEGSTIE